MKRVFLTLTLSLLSSLCFGSAEAQSNGGSIVAWGHAPGDIPPPNSGFIAIAVGEGHALGLRSDGSIASWGADGYGQCDVPGTNSEFIAVAAGAWHSLGLKSDGSIVAWGANHWNEGYGQCDVPEPNSGFVAISAGFWHSLGLKSNGTIVAWGRNDYHQCDVPAPLTKYRAIAGGGLHTVAITRDGSIVAWGWDGYGQCDVPDPNPDFVSAAAGGCHTIGLKRDGSVLAWGWNEMHQCDPPSPNSGFLAVAAGECQSLCLRSSDGVIVSMPDLPPYLDPNFGFVAVSSSAYCNLALTNGWNPAGVESGSSLNRSFAVVAAPNPFSVMCRISWRTSTAGPVTAVVFDPAGRVVRTVWGGVLNGHAFSVDWDGRDDSDRAVPAGIYMIRLTSGAGAAARRVVKMQ